MKQKKILFLSALKYAFCTFFTHIVLYIGVALLISSITASLIIGKDYIFTPHCNQRAQLIINLALFQNIFRFWFQCTCMIIAVRLIHTGTTIIQGLKESILYAPQFLVIHIFFCLPTVLVTWISLKSISHLMLLPAMLLEICAWIWHFYGQFAVPLFVMNKRGIWDSISASIYHVHQVLWNMLALTALYKAFAWGIGHKACAMIIAFVMLHVGLPLNAETARITGLLYQPLAHYLGYPIIALSYVYLLNQTQWNARLYNN